MLGASDFFRNSNYAECALWCVLGLLVLLLGGRYGVTLRGRVGLFLVLVAFGISDVVEAGTGAWWRPWWLLAWKAACVAVLVAAVVACGIRQRQRRQDDSSGAG